MSPSGGSQLAVKSLSDQAKDAAAVVLANERRRVL
jgi:hypothetical protein